MVREGQIHGKAVNMPNLTDYIEEYIKKMLALSSDQCIEVKRRELAVKFSCVPSQINYVLERRFSPERGYLVESRRGGSGCIKIYRLNGEQAKAFHELIEDACKNSFDSARLKQLIERMREEKIISRREAAMLEAITGKGVYENLGLNSEQSIELRHRLFKGALQVLIKPGY